jgi:hypothetical protein
MGMAFLLAHTVAEHCRCTPLGAMFQPLSPLNHTAPYLKSAKVENEMNVERLTTSVEHHLHQRGVTAEFAHALATCSMRGHLAKLNGNANLIPPKRQLVQEAISLLTNDFARAVYAADEGIS